MQARILIYITTFIFYTSALLIHDGLIAGVTNKQGATLLQTSSVLRFVMHRWLKIIKRLGFGSGVLGS